MQADQVDAILAQWARQRPDLDASPMGVIGRISRAARLLERELETVFQAHGLDSAGFDVLATLRRSGSPFVLSASTLADAMMVARSSTTSRIDRLEAAGLVARVPDDADGRGIGVSLTVAGLAVIDDAVAAHVANETRLLAALPPQARERLAGDCARCSRRSSRPARRAAAPREPASGQSARSRTGSGASIVLRANVAVAPALAQRLGGEVAADHEDERAELQQHALPGRVDAEPEARPVRACAGPRSA